MVLTDQSDSGTAGDASIIGSLGRRARSGLTREEREHRARLERRQQRIKQTKICCKRFWAFVFSHIGLSGLVVAYTLIGGVIFQSVEKEDEQRVKQEMVGLKNRTLDKFMSILLSGYNNESILRDSPQRAEVRRELENYTKNILESIQDKGWNGKFPEEENKWTFEGALLFAVTIITTIGYGHITPSTKPGKFLSMLYAFFGIPLMFMYLSTTGDYLADVFRVMYSRLCRKGCDKMWSMGSKQIGRRKQNGEVNKLKPQSYNYDCQTWPPDYRVKLQPPTLKTVEKTPSPTVKKGLLSKILTNKRNQQKKDCNNDDQFLETTSNQTLVKSRSDQSYIGNTKEVPKPVVPKISIHRGYEPVNQEIIEPSSAIKKDISSSTNKSSGCITTELVKSVSMPLKQQRKFYCHAKFLPAKVRLPDEDRSPCGPSVNDGPPHLVNWRDIDNDLEIGSYEDFMTLPRRLRDVENEKVKSFINTHRSIQPLQQLQDNQCPDLLKPERKRSKQLTPLPTPVKEFPNDEESFVVENYSSEDSSIGDGPEPFDAQTRRVSYSSEGKEFLYGSHDTLESFEERQRRAVSKKSIKSVTVPIYLSLFIMSTYIIVGAIVFSTWENEDLLKWAYFCFITLSTIGFGDIVPGTKIDSGNPKEKMIFLSLYVAIGLSVFAMCFKLMEEEVVAKVKRLGRKIGIIKKKK